MANKHRNEMEIRLDGNTILLRPTFENIESMEQVVGSVAYLTWKYSRGAGKGATDTAIKNMPTLTEAAKIIYFNQAATNPEDPTLKKYSLEEIWGMVSVEGIKVLKIVIEFLGQIASGDTVKKIEDISEAEKKS